MNTNQILSEVEQPELRTNLVESIPVQEGTKLSAVQFFSWEDLRGLCWTDNEEDWN